jgi:O-acetyl-ADP-ribose deacetylase (regulator of RNase III)
MIHYLVGDATYPWGEGNKVIAHCCNNKGAWGSGFVLALNKRWEMPELAYKSLNVYNGGKVQFVPVSQNIIVANIIGQDGYGTDGKQYVNYEWIDQGLGVVNDFADLTNSTIHMPRIGCGLAGGTWDKMEQIIEDTRSFKNSIFVYDL